MKVLFQSEHLASVSFGENHVAPEHAFDTCDTLKTDPSRITYRDGSSTVPYCFHTQGKLVKVSDGLTMEVVLQRCLS